MQRRSFLVWFGRAVYTTCAAVVALPVASYLNGPRKRVGGGPARRRLTRLDALPPGEPTLLPVVGVREDAWTTHPQQTIGLVWAVRRSPAETPPEQAEVQVFNAHCPHAGCAVSKAVGSGFVCPCHGARFEPSGARTPDGPDYANASPRGLDPLGHAVVRDEATGQWWVEVAYHEFEAGLAERIPKV